MLFIGLGSLLYLIGMIWLIITAITTGKTGGEKALWALVNFFCQPLGGIIYVIVSKKGVVPLILLIIGYLMCMGGILTDPQIMRMMT